MPLIEGGWCRVDHQAHRDLTAGRWGRLPSAIVMDPVLTLELNHVLDVACASRLEQACDASGVLVVPAQIAEENGMSARRPICSLRPSHGPRLEAGLAFAIVGKLHSGCGFVRIPARP
jgi:hypothetical protein